jgi:phosphoribosylanthranilate isomerase
MTILIKICGLSTPETMRAALDAGADMVGLVFFAKSPRNIAIERAIELAAMARGRAEIVALMVDPKDSDVAEVVGTVRPDLLQLHGRESPQRVAVVADHAALPVMKAVGVAKPEDIALARSYLPAAERLLLDAKAPPGAAHPGGNGLAFDWRLVADLDPPLSFMLSGGLTPETVADAVRLTRPAGIDVSSGVERAPGVKDPALIEAFVRAARAAASGSGP